MICVIKQGATRQQIDSLIAWVRGKGLDVNYSQGSQETILGLIGDTSRVDVELLESMSIVESVTRVSEPFKLTNRKFHPDDTVVHVADGVDVGGGSFQVIAGPCAVEGEGLFRVAEAVQKAGATMLRGGAYKPRTSPYSNQGMGEEGLDLLVEARERFGMPIVTEIMDARDLPLFLERKIDVLQIGARNMQNFALLREVGRTRVPVLLKRGMAATIDELLMAAEYVMSEGNPDVILCERGIRTFEKRTRNTFDLNAVPVLHQLTHLPVVADPSHSTGYTRYVSPMALAATACGADGLEIEVHDAPQLAWSDGSQALLPQMFEELMPKVFAIRGIVA